MKMSLVSSQSPLLDIVAIESSALANVAYDNECATFRVEFRDGTVYQYLGVPRDNYENLLRADSKGAYFNHHIRSRFPHTILRAAVTASSG
jgi:hypothetical protein